MTIRRFLHVNHSRNLRRRLLRIERKILRITGMNPDDFRWTRSQRKIERVGELIGERKVLLDRMFAGTPEEVARMERVNGLLFDLTQQMYCRSAALYRKVLTTTYDPTFDDDVMVEGTLKYNCDGDNSVLCMTKNSDSKTISTTERHGRKGLCGTRHSNIFASAMPCMTSAPTNLIRFPICCA